MKNPSHISDVSEMPLQHLWCHYYNRRLCLLDRQKGLFELTFLVNALRGLFSSRLWLADLVHLAQCSLDSMGQGAQGFLDKVEEHLATHFEKEFTPVVAYCIIFLSKL